MHRKKIAALAVAAAIGMGGISVLPQAEIFETGLTVSAANSGTYGTMMYTIYDSYAAITGFDNSVTSVTIPSRIEGIPVTTIGAGAFKNATRLTSVTIPAGVTSIEREAFYQCSALETVSLPSTLTSIGESAFNGCVSMQKITFPDSLKEIGESAFANCVWLLEVSFPGNLTCIPNSVCRDCTSLTSVMIENGPYCIGTQAFCGCTALKSIYLPLSVTEFQGGGLLNYHAFYKCSVSDVYYAGSFMQWNAIKFISSLDSATIHYGATDPVRPVSVDLTGDGQIDASDASLILQFSAYIGAGGTMTIEAFLEARK